MNKVYRTLDEYYDIETLIGLLLLDIEEVKQMLLKSKDSKVNYYKMKWNQNFEINKI